MAEPDLKPKGGEGYRDFDLSNLDRELLGFLQQNSRFSYSDLAKKLGVSRTTVKERIARLKEQGIIQRFTVELAGAPRPELQGTGAFFHVKLRRPVCSLVFQVVRGWPELIGCWSIAGETDMTLQVLCSSMSQLEALRDRLTRHPEITVIRTEMILRQWAYYLNPSSNNPIAPS